MSSPVLPLSRLMVPTWWTISLTSSPTVNVAGGDLSHWLVSPQLEGKLTVAKDPGTGSYAFLRDARTDRGAIGSIFGRDVLKSTAVYDGDATPPVTGIAGDFANSAIFGTVEGIKVDISDQATVTKGGAAINLWQRNMFAIRAEVEVGFIVRDAAHFVKITNDEVLMRLWSGSSRYLAAPPRLLRSL